MFPYLSCIETFSGFRWNELHLGESIFECLTSNNHKFVRDDIETRTMIAGPLSIVDPCQGLVDNFSTPRFRDGLRAPQSFTLLRFLRAQLKDWPHVWCILFLFLFATCASLPAAFTQAGTHLFAEPCRHHYLIFLPSKDDDIFVATVNIVRTSHLQIQIHMMTVF